MGCGLDYSVGDDSADIFFTLNGRWRYIVDSTLVSMISSVPAAPAESSVLTQSPPPGGANCRTEVYILGHIWGLTKKISSCI